MCSGRGWKPVQSLGNDAQAALKAGLKMMMSTLKSYMELKIK